MTAKGQKQRSEGLEAGHWIKSVANSIQGIIEDPSLSWHSKSREFENSNSQCEEGLVAAMSVDPVNDINSHHWHLPRSWDKSAD